LTACGDPGEDVQIVESVLSGVINERISGWLPKNGAAAGECPADRGLLIAEPLLTRAARDGSSVKSLR